MYRSAYSYSCLKISLKWKRKRNCTAVKMSKILKRIQIENDNIRNRTLKAQPLLYYKKIIFTNYDSTEKLIHSFVENK